ncbi:MAG: hypothetical protein H6742_06940 [Alphaproteobacteria bacterium]|nr:hypothetical protein [Alphaproteobacteria bacterium]
MAEQRREPAGFQVWVRRVSPDTDECSLRFRTSSGKGVLRVSRPGVLIVPPARTTGFEDHLNPAQVRASEFLHITARGRESFRMLALTDGMLDRLEPEVWTELVRSAEDPMQLTLDGAGPVLKMGGRSANDSLVLPEDGDVTQVEGFVVPSELAASVEFSTPVGLTDVPDPGRALPSPRAPMVQEDVSDIIDVVTGAVLMEGEVFDEVIEADPDTAASGTYDSFQLMAEPDGDTADSFLDDDPSALRTMLATPSDLERLRAAGPGEQPPIGGGRDPGAHDSLNEPLAALSAEISSEPPTEPPDPPTEPPLAPTIRLAQAPAPAPAVDAIPAHPPIDGPERTLVRMLRAQLHARRLEVYDLKERIRQLEAELANRRS